MPNKDARPAGTRPPVVLDPKAARKASFHAANKRLFFLDLDGTLDVSRARASLATLCQNPKNVVNIVSNTFHEIGPRLQKPNTKKKKDDSLVGKLGPIPGLWLCDFRGRSGYADQIERDDKDVFRHTTQVRFAWMEDLKVEMAAYARRLEIEGTVSCSV
ncbi:Trehalose-6-phosphate phosphatase [Pseudohyphozyma bogoriensis]|nr:Trehalose-6-phosphate phosphatase [Pseudohyphozyma bogoriensis]